MAGTVIYRAPADSWESCAAKLKLFCDGNTSDCEVILQSHDIGEKVANVCIASPKEAAGGELQLIHKDYG